jgi:hypothetical protein
MSLSRGSAVQLSALLSISRAVLDSQLKELQHQIVFEFSGIDTAQEAEHIQDLLEFCEDTLDELGKGILDTPSDSVRQSNARVARHN